MTLWTTSPLPSPDRRDSESSFSSSVSKLHYTNPLLVGGSSAAVVLSSYFIWARYLRRIPNADYLTQSRLGGRAIRGVVTSVGDADNFRIWHKPLFSLRSVPTTRTALKDQTIHIRLAGVDAPELAHFGNPAQPFSSDALDWLTRAVHGRTVVVQLYSKDRFGRVVGMAYVRRFPWLVRRNVSEEMLKQGYATVYTQAGAVHGGLLARFQALEAKAKAAKKGMWAQSQSNYESPAAFKKRVAKKSRGVAEDA